MLTLSIFISSPGDVAEERTTARRVIAELEDSPLLRDKINFQAISWDDPHAVVPMEAGVTPQDSVNRYAGRPSECDLTLVILWSRIGTPLPPNILRVNGSRYESGTVWELEDARNANRPVWIYRRSGKPPLDEKAPDFAARSNQFNEIENFFAGFTNPDGSLRSGFNSYSDPVDFARQLRQHLEAFVSERLSRIPARPTPKPPLRLPPHAVVGREELVKKILAGLEAGQRDFAFVFLPGVGKTAIAAMLVNDHEVMQHFPDGVLWVHLGQSPDICLQLSRWASALGVQTTESKDAAELGEAVAKAIGEGHMLLVIDDVWTTEACEHFMIGRPNCARIITTRITDIANELIPDREAVLRVNELGVDDGFQLLASLAPLAAKIVPDRLRQLVARVDGLPIALVLIGKMLQRDEDDELAIESTLKELDNIRQVFQKKKPLEFAEERHFTWEEVVEASYRALGAAGALNRDENSGDQLRLALEALSVLRPDPAWFPLSLARLATGAPNKMIKTLAGSGLVEWVRFDSDSSQKSEARYSMHRMVAEHIRAKVPPGRLLAINQIAASFYLKQLKELEERYQNDKATTYSVMYRYEDFEWQGCQDNWLYYFAQTGYGAEASLSFLRAWFDGFWWWCCFTAEGFDFCDQLLAEWDHKLVLAADGAGQDQQGEHVERLKQGIALLRRFKNAYPKETEDRGSGSWPEVKKALHELLGMTGLDGNLAKLTSPDARHVRALIDIFLAEAERFGKGDLALAEASYREAVMLFREAGEKWNIAWSLYHLADMLSELRRHDEAGSLCAEALTFGQAENDLEVIANIYRLRGDCALAGRRVEETLCNYQLAVEYAYRFQVQPEDPDSYTIHCYSDMVRRVAGRLLDARAALPAEIQYVALTLRQAWSACSVALATAPDEVALLSDATAELLAERLFPPVLPLEKLKSDGASYADIVRGHLAAVEQLHAQAAGAG